MAEFSEAAFRLHPFLDAEASVADAGGDCLAVPATGGAGRIASIPAAAYRAAALSAPCTGGCALEAIGCITRARAAKPLGLVVAAQLEQPRGGIFGFRLGGHGFSPLDINISG